MAFPVTGILDDFNRADTGPPPGASWSSGSVISGSAGLTVVSQRLTWSAGQNSNVWTTAFGPDQEAYCTLATIPGDNQQVLLYLRLKETGATTVDGYCAHFLRSDSFGGARVYLYRVDNNVETQLGSIGNDLSALISNGYKIGLRMVGSVLSAFTNRGSGWTTVGNVANDATYAAGGLVGIAFTDAVAAVDDFGGGAIYADFPKTSVLDDFNRANEGPPPSASWTGLVKYANRLIVSSNKVTSNSASAAGDAAWTQTFDQNQEAFATLAANGSGVSLYGRVRSFGASTVNGYQLYVSPGISTASINRLDNGGVTQLGASIACSGSVGTKYGLRCIGSTINAYQNAGGGWQQIATRTEGTWTGTSSIGVEVDDSSASLDDFGGGALPVDFPTVGIPLADDFNRANTGPPPGSPWASGGFYSASSSLKVDTNKLANTASDGGYLTADYGPDIEAVVTVDTVMQDNTSTYVWGRTNSVGGSSVNGYSVRFYQSSTDCRTLVNRVDNGSLTQIGGTSYSGGKLVAGDKLGIRIKGTEISAWEYHSGAWTLQNVQMDGAYAGAGKLGLVPTDAGLGDRYDDLYAGTLPFVSPIVKTGTAVA